jgi:hypothetical protein
MTKLCAGLFLNEELGTLLDMIVQVVSGSPMFGTKLKEKRTHSNVSLLGACRRRGRCSCLCLCNTWYVTILINTTAITRGPRNPKMYPRDRQDLAAAVSNHQANSTASEGRLGVQLAIFFASCALGVCVSLSTSTTEDLFWPHTSLSNPLRKRVAEGHIVSNSFSAM